MRVHHHHAAELGKLHAAPAAAKVKGEAKTSFAAVLADSTTTTGTAGSNTAPAKAREDRDDALPKGPKGETSRAVPDHPAYVEVMSGPRNGMFINTTHNERRGEAFVLVRKGDRDLHIYGTGRNRRVIISWHKDQPAHRDEKQVAPAKDAKQAEPATGGTTAPAA
jgi:hypothetical protein